MSVLVRPIAGQIGEGPRPGALRIARGSAVAQIPIEYEGEGNPHEKIYTFSLFSPLAPVQFPLLPQPGMLVADSSFRIELAN
jgi:hypothetical protein